MAKSSNVKDSVNKAGFPIPVGNYIDDGRRK